MFRSPQGKILRHMFEHPVVHDLADAPASEKGLIFLLMSASGMPAQPDGSYSTNGCMRYQFSDLSAAFSTLRSRGLLAEPNPPEVTISETLVPELKELLRAHGLPVSGRRAELIDRLLPALSESEFAELAEKHRVCYPSELGFEMIYSLYDLWERRQIDLIDALLIGRLTGNFDAIYNALRHMSFGIGFWDDSVSTPFQDRDTLRTALAMPTIGTAFSHLVGFSPEFNIRSIEDVMHSAPLWMNSDSKPYLSAPQKPIFDSPRISYVPQKSVSDPPRAVFAPLPDPEPAPPKERHTGKTVFGIVVAIVLIILLFFS